MTLYHGSERIIETPQFGAGNPRNDYGVGFYCTQHLELAKEWACQKNMDGFANEYELDLLGLSVLDVSGAEYTIFTLAVYFNAKPNLYSKNFIWKGKS